jgi:hypothetical protein
MSAPNRYFDAQPAPPAHPRFRAWDATLARPEVARVQVELRRERSGLLFQPARLFVSFLDEQGAVVPPMDEVAWEPILESWLQAHGVRAVSTENEALRASLLLRAELREVLQRYGDGYFTAVLLAEVGDGLGAAPRVAEVLQHIHTTPPSLESASYEDCRQQIEGVLRGQALRLLQLYDGDRDTAEAILSEAVALYLDDRFSVTNRALLGLA